MIKISYYNIYKITNDNKKRTSPLSGLVRFSLTAATLAGCGGGVGRLSLRAEGRGRERHRVESTAGIVILGRDALLVGHGILGGIYQILRRTLNSDY